MVVRTSVFRRSGLAGFVRGCALGAACALTLSVAIIPMRTAVAQAAAAKTNIDDTWQGTLHQGQDIRVVFKIVKGPDGVLKGTLYRVDQPAQPLPLKSTTFVDGELKFGLLSATDTDFAGKLSPDGTTITGEWKQAEKPLPLILLRATPETAWAIPEPPKKLPAMAEDADPSFDVATIKLTPADFRGKGFGGPPGSFMTRGTTLSDLVGYAYRVHPKQVVGAPDWADTVKFDITAKPDTPGQPSEKQTQAMMKKLLASRFGLKFHDDKKEMSAYVLTVAKGGPKMDKSQADPHDPSTFAFRQLGNLVFRNISMTNFASWMQGVLDRPVVDQSGLPGYFDGTLKWNPDETQFAIFGPPPTPSTAPDAPPDLYKAIQEQIGMKLEAGKPTVAVMVIDHVEKPSDN